MIDLNRLLISFAILPLFQLIAACDGGGDPVLTQADPQTTSQDSQNTPSTSGNPSINGGLTGRLLTTHEGRPIQIDISSGAVSDVPIDSLNDWLSRQGLEANSDTAYLVSGNESSGRYVETINECRFVSQDVAGHTIDGYYDTCVSIYNNQDYQTIRRVRINDRQLSGPAKLSPSGQYLAMNDYFWPSCCRRSTILLMDVAQSTLEVTDSFTVNMGEVEDVVGESPLDWTPNNELVYSLPSDSKAAVYITKPGSLEVAMTIRLPATYQGDIYSLDVSPSGTQVLIGYNPRQGPYLAGVLLLDLDTLNLSVPAVVPSEANIVPLVDNIQGFIRNPRWSPDGEWILVVNGQSTLTTGLGAAFTTDPNLYAVPARSSHTVLTTEQQTEAVLISTANPSDPQGVPDTEYRGNVYLEWVN